MSPERMKEIDDAMLDAVETVLHLGPVDSRLPPVSPTDFAPPEIRDEAEIKRAVDGAPDFVVPRGDVPRVGEFAQEQSTAYKEIKKGCNVHPGAAKLAFKLDAMEDTKRDDFLRSLKGLMAALNLGLSSDLVDQAEGDDDADGDIIPVKASSRPSLMPVH